jgi:hypothetical protein
MMPARMSSLTRKTVLTLLVGAGLLLLTAANSHLVYVATISQPDCVAHVRQSDDKSERGQFRAAVSSCQPQ